MQFWTVYCCNFSLVRNVLMPQMIVVLGCI